MEWYKLFPDDKKPAMSEIADYIGEAKELWLSLIDYFSNTYKAAPKLSYSKCSLKPGWSIKFSKNGQSFGTLYPEEGSFSVFIVISYKLDTAMEYIIPFLSTETVEQYSLAGDYMKLGKCMMFQINDNQKLEDYKKIVEPKLANK